MKLDKTFMTENINFQSKNVIILSLASLARNLEFSLASRKTSKTQEIGHYSPYVHPECTLTFFGSNHVQINCE